jgi:tRNA(Ser,Leu) C12 N-acetylase TAN1
MLERETPAMEDWNVVATSRIGRFDEARKLLGKLGPVHRTGFYNVLVMRCDDVDRLLADLVGLLASEKAAVAHVRPARATFGFRTPDEFEELSRRIVLAWAPRVVGQRFHVRMHRRGFRGRLSSPQEEHILDDELLDALGRTGEPGSLSFEDPDAILAIDTVADRAGLALWTREELHRYPFLGLD